MKIAALSLVLVASAAQAQYKCTSADGSVSFQQSPCATGAKAERLVLPAATQPTARSEAIAWAIANRRVMVGMNRDELRRVMLASPERVNITVAAGVTSEQQVYYRPNNIVYVYLDDGVVSAVQLTDR